MISHYSSGKADLQVQLHGWDAAGCFWHGPTEVAPDRSNGSSILKKLAKSAGPFHGKLSYRLPGFPAIDFHTSAWDLMDSGLAVLHLDGIQSPVAALAVIPDRRRSRLRNEFAFGLVAHLHFLTGLIAPDSELPIIDYMEAALRENPSSSLAFALETGESSSDVGIVLAGYLDKLSVAMLRWLRMNDSERNVDSAEIAASAARIATLAA